MKESLEIPQRYKESGDISTWQNNLIVCLVYTVLFSSLNILIKRKVKNLTNNKPINQFKIYFYFIQNQVEHIL